jgi:hypothetical protein
MSNVDPSISAGHRVAVVLPTRNRWKGLCRVLECLRAQTFRDFVVVVSDDASTDATAHSTAAHVSGLQVRWKRHPQGYASVVAHFNALWSEGAEPLVALAHDDEYYAPDWLASLVACFDADASTCLACAHAVVVDRRDGPARAWQERRQLPEGRYDRAALLEHLVVHHRRWHGNGFMTTRAAAAQAAPMNPDYEQFDFEWMARLALGGRTAVVGKPLHTYTMHPGNTVGSPAYLERYLAQITAPAMMRQWARECGTDPGVAAVAAGYRSAWAKALVAQRPDLARKAVALAHDHGSGPLWAFFARAACQPGLAGLASLLLRGAFAVHRRRWRCREAVDPIDAHTFAAWFGHPLEEI